MLRGRMNRKKFLNLTLEPPNKTVYVAKHPEIADERAFKGKNWRAVPPDMTTRRLNTKHLATVIVDNEPVALRLI